MSHLKDICMNQLMSAENGEETLNSRHACASCKHQRKRCDNNCVFAPHFPANRANYFREVQKIFGVKNVGGILAHLSPQDRQKAVESLEWEALAWKEDPIEGPLGLFRKLEKELELLKNQQNNDTIMSNYDPYQTDGFNHNSVAVGIVAKTNMINIATNFGYGNNYHNPNLDAVPMNNYAGLLQRSADTNIENQRLDNYNPVGPCYTITHQGQGRRSVILQERGLGVVPQTTAILPKQEMQRNEILGCSSLRPAAAAAANSFNHQGNHHQRGSQGSVHAYLDGSVNGSQGRGLH
ncbi:hypothetical protein REPUB_Repub14bG0119200 [Reevesia pubescens]